MWYRSVPVVPASQASTERGRRGSAAAASFLLLAAVVGCGRSPNAGEGRPGQPVTQPPPSRLVLPDGRENLSVEDRADWHEAVNWSQTCENDFRATRASDDGGMVFHTVSPGVSIIHVLCAMGAYQPSSLFVRLDERSPRPMANVLTFETYQSFDGVSIEKIRSIELTGEPWFSPDTRELAMFSFSRQTRDCGIWTRYAVGDGTPEVRDVRARLPCADRPGPPIAPGPGIPPPEWTTVERAPA